MQSVKLTTSVTIAILKKSLPQRRAHYLSQPQTFHSKRVKQMNWFLLIYIALVVYAIFFPGAWGMVAIMTVLLLLGL